VASGATISLVICLWLTFVGLFLSSPGFGSGGARNPLAQVAADVCEWEEPFHGRGDDRAG